MYSAPGRNRLACFAVSLRWELVRFGALIRGSVVTVTSARGSRAVVVNATHVFPKSLTRTSNEALDNRKHRERCRMSFFRSHNNADE